MKKKYLFNILIIVVLLTLSACSAAGTGNAPVDNAKKPIKVGLCLPLTGVLASLGESYELGIALAMDQLKNEIAGHPIEIYKADNKANATDAVSAVRKLAEVDQVDVIIGCGSSSATLPAIPIIKEVQVPTIEASSTNAFVYNQIGVGGNEWLFKINPDDLIMGQGFAEYIASKEKSIVIVGNDNQMARGAGEVYTNQFKKLGL
ncbi:MAG TPA: ABC transporter substrate-binding protein, partial [Bellilinea sp.]|nr:ABC transporter substrate-binding protein [Bellilinea sp.]